MTAAGTILGPSRFISAVIGWRLWILVVWGAVTVSSTVVYVSNFRIDNSVEIWFLEDDPELEAYRRFNTGFGEREWTHIWLRGDSVFSPEFLRDLQLVGDRIVSLESVERVLSLTEVGGISPGPKGLPVIEKFYPVEAGETLSGDQAIELRGKIRGSPLFEGLLVPRGDDRFTILAVQNANRIDAIGPYRIRLVDEIRAAVSSYPTFLEFGIVGTTVVNSELNRAAMRDMLIYYTLIAAFLLIGGGFALRRVRDLVVLCSVVLGTILPVMGFVAACRLPFNLMTVMLPTLLVTVSVSYLIHFLSEFHSTRREMEERGERVDPTVAISTTFGRLLRPGLWTSVTTAIGFASLTVSPVAPIRHIGFFAALGIGLAWINTITVAPALLSLLWRGNGSEGSSVARNGKGVGVLGWLARPRPILASLLGGAMLVGASGSVWLEADTDYVKFFRPGSTLREDYAQVERLGMPGSYLTIAVKIPSNTHFGDMGRHRSMREFETSLLSVPGVVEIQSLDKIVEQSALDLSNTDVGDAEFSFTKMLPLVLSEYRQLGNTEDFLAQGGSLLQLRVMTGPMSTRDIDAFRNRLAGLAADLPVGWDVTVTGTNVLWANMDAHVVRTQLLSIGITASVLLVLLPLVFRSLVLGILGFAVSFVPVVCTLGLMAWLGLPVNIATCILGGVVIGLAVDDTIYYLARVREGMLMGMPVGDAARRATSTTGRAMIKTSVILTGGFLTMAASDFMPSVYFGIFFAFSIVVALLADLIVLPVLLRLAQPLMRQRPQPEIDELEFGMGETR